MLKVWHWEKGDSGQRKVLGSVSQPPAWHLLLFQHPQPCSPGALGQQGPVSAPPSLLPAPPAGLACCSESRVWILASSRFSPSLTFLPQSFL